MLPPIYVKLSPCNGVGVNWKHLHKRLQVCQSTCLMMTVCLPTDSLPASLNVSSPKLIQDHCATRFETFCSAVIG